MKNSEKSIFTKRETEVLKLVIKGFTNQKIACILEISTSTAKAHVKNIMNKLKVSNRVELVVGVIRKYPEFLKQDF